MAQLPKKWSRRVFAVYMVVTIFGGLILFLFIILLGLTYWMSAPAPLPDPNLLIHPKATAWLVVHANGLRDLPQGALQFLTGGAPPQIAHLIARADGNQACPLQIVLSAFPGEHGPEKSLAVSLGRFPGQFWLVRRDLERRVERQVLPLSLRYRQRKAIFSADDPSSPLNTLSLAECTLLRCGSTAAMETLIDRLEKKAELSADRWPRALSARPLAGFQGWAATWQEIPFKVFFPADSTPVRLAAAHVEALSTQFPALAASRNIQFDGVFHDRKHAEMRVTLPTDKLGAAALAAKLNDWLKGNKLTGYAQVDASGDSVELMRIEVPFEED
jgi:hypothetical protein